MNVGTKVCINWKYEYSPSFFECFELAKSLLFTKAAFTSKYNKTEILKYHYVGTFPFNYVFHGT